MTTAEKQVIVSIPSIDMDIFNIIARKFGWTTCIEESKVKKHVKTPFEKSQEDIKAGRVNTYRNSDEMFKILSDVFN